MADFIRGTINGNLTEIPGIGPKTAEKLAEGDDAEKVTNTYQLIGKVRECLFNECFFFQGGANLSFLPSRYNSFSCLKDPTHPITKLNAWSIVRSFGIGFRAREFQPIGLRL